MTEQPLSAPQHSTAVIDNGAFGTREITFSTGRLARQAAGSALAQLGDTVVLSATTASKHPKEQFDFFPLTVDVEERMYAAGRIPGSFFRREGRPERGRDPHLPPDRPAAAPVASSRACATRSRSSRPCSRSTRPTRTTSWRSTPRRCRPSSSGLPFSGPIGATRVAHIDGQWVAFPTHEELDPGHLRHGRRRPGPARRRRRDHDGRGRGHRAHVAPDRRRRRRADRGGRGQRSRGRQAGHPRAVPGAAASWPTSRPSRSPSSRSSWTTRTTSTPRSRPPPRGEVAEALKIAGKAEREDALDRIKDAGRTSSSAASSRGARRRSAAAFRSVTKKEVRARVLRDQVRIDGRGPRDIRPLTAEVGVLPRVHGSALFERGETQIMGVTTLNMLRMEQALDTLSPEKSKRYMHNYNFPPYSTGETGRVGSPKRREIGHGALAERALIPVLPSREEFPYAIRQVSEALGSNGSTSMGSVCASHDVAAVRRCAAQGAGRRHRDGPHLRRGRRQDVVRHADRHPRRRGRVRRHGLQGRRYVGVRHRAAARHQARRHPVGRAGRRAAAGARRAARRSST